MINTTSRLHSAIVAAGVAITGVDNNGKVTPAALQSAAQPAITAFDVSQTAQATFDAQQAKAAATASVDNGQLQVGLQYDRTLRALALVVLDEVNLIRANFTIAMTPRTTAQLVSAVKAKIALTAE